VVSDVSTRPLRADAERTVRTILEAAERVLTRDPAATMEEIAAAAGVARTTVHRRFSTREALIASLGGWASRQLEAAVDEARPDTAPPLVALYQATANVLRVKFSWGFSMGTALAKGGEVEEIQCRMLDTCDRLFRRLRDSGALRADVDPVWARRVYYALIHEACQDVGAESGPDADTLATQLINTLLRGVGTPTAPL
jgi:AcrR family transcriptional regulator